MKINPQILREIMTERDRQETLHPKQTFLDDFVWLTVLMEEVGEVSQDLLTGKMRDSEEITELPLCYHELVQVVSVGIAWLEAMHERKDIVSDLYRDPPQATSTEGSTTPLRQQVQGMDSPVLRGL